MVGHVDVADPREMDIQHQHHRGRLRAVVDQIVADAEFHDGSPSRVSARRRARGSWGPGRNRRAPSSAGTGPGTAAGCIATCRIPAFEPWPRPDGSARPSIISHCLAAVQNKTPPFEIMIVVRHLISTEYTIITQPNTRRIATAVIVRFQPGCGRITAMTRPRPGDRRPGRRRSTRDGVAPRRSRRRRRARERPGGARRPERPAPDAGRRRRPIRLGPRARRDLRPDRPLRRACDSDDQAVVATRRDHQGGIGPSGLPGAGRAERRRTDPVAVPALSPSGPDMVRAPAPGHDRRGSKAAGERLHHLSFAQTEALKAAGA